MPTEILRPNSNVTQTQMTGGYADIDETSASDTDFAYPNANGSCVLEVGLSDPAGFALNTVAPTIRYRLLRKTQTGGAPGAGSPTAQLHLYQGAVLIASDTARSFGGGATDFSWSPTITAVTDFTDLRLRMTETVSGNPVMAISFAEVEVSYAEALDLASGSFAFAGGDLTVSTVTYAALDGASFAFAGGDLDTIDKTFRFGSGARKARSRARRRVF